MRNIIIFIILFIFVSIIGWSQNGYREFNWGMTINEVREICIQKSSSNPYWIEINDISGIGTNAHFAIIYYLNNRIIFRIPNISGVWYGGDITSDESGMFHFYDGRLTSVIIFYSGGIQELVTRYGAGRTIEFQAFSLNGSPATIWLENRQRYIVFFRLTNRSENCVAYVDANWINTIYNNYIREIRERERQSRELLD